MNDNAKLNKSRSIFILRSQNAAVMRKLAFFVCLLCTSLSLQGQSKLTFPEYVISGVEAQVYIETADSSVNISSEQFHVQRNDQGETYISLAFGAKKNYDFSAFSHNSLPKLIPSWWAVVPPIVAIFLALLLKEVIISLFLGIFIGAATLGYYTEGIDGIFSAFLTVLDHYMLSALEDKDHLSVILFSLLIGALVAVISRNGGMQGVVNRIVRFAQTRRSGMLSTYFLGIAIFFDDYANTLVVGNTMRSVTDKLRISREKLAYIVDSTAAPVAAIAFVTTWIGAELGYIASGIEKINENGELIQEGPYSIFMNSLTYSFYPILTLVFMFLLIWKKRDFGPMYSIESETIKNGVNAGEDNDQSTVDTKEFEPADYSRIRAFNAVVPILVVIVGTIVGLLVTGMSAWENAFAEKGISSTLGFFQTLELHEGQSLSFIQRVGLIIGEANSYSALLWSSLTGLTVAIALTATQRILNLRDIMEVAVSGVKTMIPAISILVLAWSLATVTGELRTADVIKDAFGSTFPAWMIPAITFILSALIAFSTGSSWSTMALVYPIMIPTAFAMAQDVETLDNMAILYNTVASVLAGAVLGDHCSPISDTTILSSLASSCNHVSHVRTQMPYALTVGAVSLFLGIIPGALGIPFYLTFPIAIAALYAVIHFLGKKHVDLTA
jgi:Na+/H+ antiporter NhaC